MNDQSNTVSCSLCLDCGSHLSPYLSSLACVPRLNMVSSTSFPKGRRLCVSPRPVFGPCRRRLEVAITTGWWGSPFFRHPLASSWWGNKNKNMHGKELQVCTGSLHYLGTVLLGNELTDHPMILHHRFYRRQKPGAIVPHTWSEVRGPTLVTLWEVPGRVWGLASWSIGVRKPVFTEI